MPALLSPTGYSKGRPFGAVIGFREAEIRASGEAITSKNPSDISKKSCEEPADVGS
jgi:hypothetical protein